MDTSTLNTVSKPVDLAEQNALPANAGQTKNATKVKRNRKAVKTAKTALHNTAKVKPDRKAAKTTKAALHNAQQGHDDSKLGRRKTRYAESQFPFMRLPAEIRNRVYKIALKSSSGLNINMSSFKVPRLLQVSQRIRNEASGLFTAVNNLKFAVRSSYIPLAQDQQPLRSPVLTHDVGLLMLDGARSDWLKASKGVFTEFNFGVRTVCDEKFQVGAFYIGGQVNSYKLVPKWMMSFGSKSKALEEMFTAIAADINKLLQEAQARPGFAGLTFSDLEKIAKFFNYVKPELRGE